MNNEDNALRLQATYELLSKAEDTRFIKTRLKVAHPGINRNSCLISMQAFEKARPSIVNIPLLAYVQMDENQEPQFGGHEIHLETTENGVRQIYDEVPIGIIPESCNYAIEEHDGRLYVCVDGYVWRGYANYAEDVIEREDNVPLSMEITINEEIYNSVYGCMEITDFAYTGVTFLGVLPAMYGAEATKTDFASKEARFQAMLDSIKEEFAKDLEEKQKKEEDALDNPKTNPAGEGTSKENFENQNEQIKEQVQEVKTEKLQAEEIKDNAEKKETLSADNTKENDPKAQFALMSTICKGLDESLKGYVFEEAGNVFPKYWLHDLDFEKQTAYVFSLEDGEIYASDFALEGDTVVMKPQFRKQVAEYRDFVEGKDSASIGEQNFSVVFEPLKKLQQQLNEANKELETLREFQTQTLAQQKKIELESVLANFQDLNGNEEFEKLKEDMTSFSKEELEKECFAIRGKALPAKFSYDKKTFSGAPRQNLPFTPEGPGTTTHLEELIAKYSKK